MSDEEQPPTGKIKNSIQLAVENNRLGNLKSTAPSSNPPKKTFQPTNPPKQQEKKVKFLPNTTKKQPKSLSSLDQRDDSFSFGGHGYQSSKFDDHESFSVPSFKDTEKDVKFSKSSSFQENNFFKDVKLPPTSLPPISEKVATTTTKMDTNMIKEDELFFIQLPSILPITSQKPVEKQQQQHGAEYDEIWMTDFKNTLTEIPKGYIGEMLVYKSGKRKLKLGDVLFDVVPGTESQMAENVACISSDSKKVYILGDVSKRILCVPDLEACLQ